MTHAQFRRTKTWQEFRASMLQGHSRCQICNQALTKKTNVHHCFPDDYENLDPARFLVCHAHCHDYMHKICQRKDLSSLDTRLKSLAEAFLPG